MGLGGVFARWLLCLPFHGHLFVKAEDPDPGMPSEDTSPSIYSTLDIEWAETQETTTQVASFRESSLAASDVTSESITATSYTMETSERPAEGPAGKTDQKVPRPPALLRGMGISLAFLVFVGLLTVGMKRHYARKTDTHPRKQAELGPGEAQKEDEPAKEGKPIGKEKVPVDEAQTRARLEAIRELLPAAARLAAALDSPESQRLLTIVQKSVGQLEMDPAKVPDIKASLQSGLKALRSLHQDAIERAEAIMEADKFLPGPAEMGPWEQTSTEALLGGEQGPEGTAVSPLMTNLRSFHQIAVKMSRRLADVHARMSVLRTFKGERDGQLLLATAAGLEALLATNEAKQHAVTVAQHLRESVSGGVEALFLVQRENALYELQQKFEVMRLVANLAKSKTGEETSGDTESLQEVEGGIEEVTRLVARLCSECKRIRERATAVEMLAAVPQIERLEERAVELIDTLWEDSVVLPGLPDRLDSSTKKLVEAIAQRAHQRVTSEVASVKESLRQIAESGRNALPGLRNPSESDDEARTGSNGNDLMTQIGMITNAVERLADAAAHSLDYLMQSDELTSSLEQIRKIIEFARWIGDEKQKALLLQGYCVQAAGLERDMTYSNSLAARAASRVLGPSRPEKQELEKLQRQFEAARTAAMQAQTLHEGATAVAAMRAHAEAMDEIVHAYTMELLEH